MAFLPARWPAGGAVVLGGIRGGGIQEHLRETAAMGGEMTPGLEGVEGRLKNLKLSEAEKRGIKIGKKQTCSSKGTFKRIARAKDKQQQQAQPSKNEQKKRNTDLMEVDLGTGLVKKSRMEVDEEGNGKGIKEESKKSEMGSAGLQEQPGETK
ncbi:hypothetical protein TRIUR3_24289 [Triticum urartu]|uniref:Uncharacterized protein n=1 Tax=Triticum urartu TaxID=4572 RepID=M7YZW1_TRIUA|nr:hypothetical protein TRIUR3_24289 [Triticum urartu]